GQGGEDGRVRLRVDRFHEDDIGQHSLFVQGQCVWEQGNCANGALDCVKQGQPCEHFHRHFAFVVGHIRPRLQVIRQRNLLRQPEVCGQTVPDLKVFIVFNVVPVNGLVCGDALRYIVRSHATFFLRDKNCSAEIHTRSVPLGVYFKRHTSCGLYSMQDTQPSISVPSSAIWRTRT